jgi:hypothetical protein
MGQGRKQLLATSHIAAPPYSTNLSFDRHFTPPSVCVQQKERNGKYREIDEEKESERVQGRPKMKRKRMNQRK